MDEAGNVLVTGSFEGMVDLGGGALTSAGSADIFVTKIATTDPRPSFLRGDCNDDGETGGVTDALMMLTRNFVDDQLETPCVAACDVNGDGDTGGVTDALALLSNNFVGGVEIPEPFPACGPSSLASDAALGCAESSACGQ